MMTKASSTVDAIPIRKRADPLFLVAAVTIFTFIIVFAVSSSAPFSNIYSDAWEHSAALKELLANPFSPSNPHILDASPSPRFMPLYVVAGFIGHLANLDVFTIYHLLGAFNLILLLSGVLVFSRAYLDHDKAPSILLLLLFAGWGTGIIWSNAINLRSLPFVASYPSTAAFGLTLIIWSWYIRNFSERSPSLFSPANILQLSLLVALVLLTHVLTGAITIGGLILLTMTHTGFTGRKILFLLGALLISLLLVETWPYYSTLKIFTNTGIGAIVESSTTHETQSRHMMLLETHPFYQPLSVILSTGPFFLAIPLSIYNLRTRIHLFSTLGFLGLTVIYISYLFIAIPLGHRALLFAIFFAQLMMAEFLVDSLGNSAARGEKRKVAKFFLAVLFSTLTLQVILSAKDFFHYVKSNSLIPTYSEISTPVGPEDVVMSTPEDGWPLPTFSGRVIIPYHNNPLIDNRLERSQDVQRFFSPAASAEDRLDILRKWKARFILLNTSRSSSAELRTLYCTDNMKAAGNFVLCDIRTKTTIVN